jgi:hypothetical protein
MNSNHEFCEAAPRMKHPLHATHKSVPVQHGPKHLCGHDEAAGFWLYLDVAGENANIKSVFQIPVLLIADGLHRRRIHCLCFVHLCQGKRVFCQHCLACMCMSRSRLPGACSKHYQEQGASVSDSTQNKASGIQGTFARKCLLERAGPWASAYSDLEQKQMHTGMRWFMIGSQSWSRMVTPTAFS